MNRTFIITLFLLSGLAFTVNSQNSELPSVDIQTVYGEMMSTSEIENDGNPIILSFWATWCKPCIKELNTINEVYYDWQDETGVKLVAVSIDNARSSSKVLPMVNGKGWDYEVYLDPNGDFKRAMGVNMIPHTFLLNGDGEVVWQHTSFSEGSEIELIEKVRKVANGESID
ncbi:MAG TPA: TlpA disulfide reductase family protein [Bacteroidales bacterium]|nr:TlpA disulfide reductase family protein [Bacteroidales bacterium]